MKCRWFEIHRTTLVVMAIAAAGLAWLNFGNEFHFPGWPLQFSDYFGRSIPDLIVHAIVVDIVVALLALLGTGITCEWWLRRRYRMGRGWLRLHLSTTIALMIVASIFLWLNIRGYDAGIGDGYKYKYFRAVGWPSMLIYKWEDWFGTTSKDEIDLKYQLTDLSGNVLTALLALVIIATFLEWRIDRRDAARGTAT